MAAPLLLVYMLGIGIRAWLFRSSFLEWLEENNEISTPITAWKRMTEGLSLHKNGISPYSGDIFHETPVMLRFLSYMTNLWGGSIHLLFLFTDVFTAYILSRIAHYLARHLLMKQQKTVRMYSPDAQDLILKAVDLGNKKVYVAAMYLFNPYTVVSCLAKSTGVFNNLLIALAVLYTLKGHRVMTCTFIALSAYQSLYPAMLVVPAAMYIAQTQVRDFSLTKRLAVINMLWTGFIFSFIFTGLLYLSYLYEGSWNFLSSTYGFVLSVPDGTPNMGVFWYFFTEMFEHFRLFFLCVFQINAFIYTVPLAIKLRDHPIFFMYILVSLMAIFKSYPSYCDAALYIGLLPVWSHVFSNMRNNFIVTCMLIVCSVFAPILRHLWIYAGSANANFYFAISLVYSSAQIFLVTDLLYAYLRREFDLVNGVTPKLIDGKPAEVILD